MVSLRRNWRFRGDTLPERDQNNPDFINFRSISRINIDLVHFITGLMPVEVSAYGIVEKWPNGKDGFLVTPRDVDALADCLIQLLNDRSLAASIGKSARQKVLKKFSAKEMANKTLNLYKKILVNS